jgi:hypothetical protein
VTVRGGQRRAPLAVAGDAALEDDRDIWQKGGGKADLVALFDRTLEALAEAIGQLRL